jgi:hypothetical protein
MSQSSRFRWELVLGTLAVAGILLALPLVRPDLQRLVDIPDLLFLSFAVAGGILATIGLFAALVLLLQPILRRRSTWCEFEAISKQNVKAAYKLMAGFFGDETPSTTRMLEWQKRNKNVLTAVYTKELSGGKTKRRLVGIFKVLPLTQQAVELLELEQVSGATMNPSHIAGEGEEVAALYVGDVLAVDRAAKADVLRQLKAAVRRQSKAGVPIYTRPLTADGARLVRKYKFTPVLEGLPPGSVGRIHKLVVPDLATTIDAV